MPASIIVNHRHPAMGTHYQARLATVDDDLRHFNAWDAACEELDRLDRLMGRKHPSSEPARLNREAHLRPVKVGSELFAILSQCLVWYEQTDGFFDIALSPSRPGRDAAPRPLAEKMRLDPTHNTVFLPDPEVRLDLGGVGKGIALDNVATVLNTYGYSRFLLDGGRSSILARGEAIRSDWTVRLPDLGNALSQTTPVWMLADGGFSLSMALPPSMHTGSSDVIDPHSGRPLRTQNACAVIAKSAARAEILSTAILAMGEDRMAKYLHNRLKHNGCMQELGMRIAWWNERNGWTEY